MTWHELLDKANAAKAQGDYEGALLAFTKFINKRYNRRCHTERDRVELGTAFIDRAQCFEHLNRPIEAYRGYQEATAFFLSAGSDDAGVTIFLRLSELCRKMGDERQTITFGVQAILAEAALRIDQNRGEELQRLRAQIDERVAALLGPSVDDARRRAMQVMVHGYVDSVTVADAEHVIQFELPEAVAKALGRSPKDVYGEPTSGRRL